jgi:CO dehydrogenase nickel-insertion accessory protein CooC1
MWVPPSTRPETLPALLARARQETLGKVDALLLDVDASLLQSIGGLGAGIDYVTILVEAGETGLRDADQLGAQLDDRLPPYGRVGVALCRIEAHRSDDLPQQTPEHRLPVLGGFPADYLLAASDEYPAKGAEVRSPHDEYLIAIRQLARTLAEIVPLRRVVSPASSSTGNGA